MPYATQSDLEERFGSEELAQLTDRVNGSIIDAAVVGRALADAHAEIDSHLAVRYPLPLSSSPEVLVAIACDIARYRLHDERATEIVAKRYEEAARRLRALASGAAVLVGISQPAAAGGVNVTVRSSARFFDADGLAEY
ncbi:gp436 family protein [Azonexus sp.]|uniref:gp436 family protein n=1 Tax=Azonexus sp. TaxID=1872668 RepID=UPI0027BAF541|nr:DUF1320 domain-containing protein [Azonexus sp.]